MSKFFIEKLIPKIKKFYEELELIYTSECPDYCDSDYTNDNCENHIIVKEVDIPEFKEIMRNFKPTYNILDKWVESKNGIERRYYPHNKRLMMEIPYVNGKLHGIQKNYYSSGVLEEEIPWINNNRNGIGKRYYTSGELKETIIWKDDYRDWND